jgi:hypothetical protein
MNFAAVLDVASNPAQHLPRHPHLLLRSEVGVSAQRPRRLQRHPPGRPSFHSWSQMYDGLPERGLPLGDTFIEGSWLPAIVPVGKHFSGEKDRQFKATAINKDATVAASQMMARRLWMI